MFSEHETSMSILCCCFDIELKKGIPCGLRVEQFEEVETWIYSKEREFIFKKKQ